MLVLRNFTAGDIPFGMALKTQAGWNQLPRDWERLLALDHRGAFLAEWNGQAAGTVMVTLFDDVAWVSMMLVDAAVRGRGIGRELMQTAIAFAESQGALAIRLDATPMGRPLYERLGFTADFTLSRYTGMPIAADKPVQLAEAPLDDVIILDHAATGTNRKRLLELLHREEPFRGVVTDGALRGCISSRDGSQAVQVGPCIADEATGPQLLAAELARHAARSVILDIPDEHAAAIRTVTQHGLSASRPLLRMTRGRPVRERPLRLWATFGPEKG